MAIVYLPYRKSERRRMPRPPMEARGSYYPLTTILKHEEQSQMRDGDPCPHCGWTRQARFGIDWHWICCGRTVPQKAAT